MHHHPNTILAMHHERQHRLEVEAARFALTRSLRRRRRLRRRRPQGMIPDRVWLGLRSIPIEIPENGHNPPGRLIYDDPTG